MVPTAMPPANVIRKLNNDFRQGKGKAGFRSLAFAKTVEKEGEAQKSGMERSHHHSRCRVEAGHEIDADERTHEKILGTPPCYGRGIAWKTAGNIGKTEKNHDGTEILIQIWRRSESKAVPQQTMTTKVKAVIAPAMRN